MKSSVLRFSGPFFRRVNRLDYTYLRRNPLTFPAIAPSVRCFGTIDHRNMSPLDVEKELFRMKRAMGTHFSNGSYDSALSIARDLEREVVDIMGGNNAVHASCINNIGLMLKMLGKLQPALDHYEKALKMYEEAVGTNHTSYYSTLANIGALYKSKADTTTDPSEYVSCLEKAEAHLTTAIGGQKDLVGANSVEVLVNENHLAIILKRTGRANEAEEKFIDTLALCREKDRDSTVALTLNNYGVLLKESGRFDEAEEKYDEALALRKAIGGERHGDTILVMHNMAELYEARGDPDKANDIREKILALLEVQPEPEKWSDAEVQEHLPSYVKGQIPIEDKRPFFDPKIHGGRG